MASALVQHLRIARALARVGVVRKSQFKVEFWAQVIMDCVWYATHIGVFEILYSQTPDIAGWSRAEFRVLLGYLFVSDAFMMIWLGKMWRFGRDLKDGELDAYRVRPAWTLVLYGFSQFSLEACVNMAFAIGYLVYAVAVAHGGLDPGVLLVAAAAAVLSFWVRVIVITLFSVAELWAIGSDATRFLHELLFSATDRPMDIFGPRLRAFLLYIVPVGALTQVPASMVLGHYSVLEALAVTAWFIALGLLVFAAWDRSFRRYESARG